jgi:hypothetical protein
MTVLSTSVLDMNGQNGQRVGYQRVSTADRNTARQLDGVDVDKTFTDNASGKDANRTELAGAPLPGLSIPNTGGAPSSPP